MKMWRIKKKLDELLPQICENETPEWWLQFVFSEVLEEMAKRGSNTPLSKQISGCCFPQSPSLSPSVCHQSCASESRGEMDWHLTSETFWLPIFLLMPREPTLAKPHDRQPIKEYNDLPTLLCVPASPPSLLLLYALWLISKLTCLSSTAAFQLKWPAQ